MRRIEFVVGEKWAGLLMYFFGFFFVSLVFLNPAA